MMQEQSGRSFFPSFRSMLIKGWNFLVFSLSTEEKSFTSGNIQRALILLAIPMILEMMMESLFAVVDAFFVAKVGTEAIATVGFTESVITLIYSLAFGLAMAATAVVARRIGEEDPDAAAKSGAQAIVIGVVLAIILGAIGVVFAPDILRMMGGSDSLVANGTTYTRIMLGTNVVIIMLFLLNGIFRGAGDANMAMWSLLIANGINIVLDPMLILGIGPFPELGLKGAAIATVIGRGIGVLFQLYILFGRSGTINLKWHHFRPSFDLMKRISDIAATGAGQFLIASASWIFLMRIVAVFGTNVAAGYTIAIRLIIFSILPAFGIANAATTLVGQNLGAEQPDRAEKSVWMASWYNIGFLVFVSICYFIFADQLIVFFSDNAEVHQAAEVTLKIMSAGFSLFAFGMVLSHAFNGAGDTRTPTWVNFICFWLIEIPLGYLLAVTLNWEIYGVCWAIVISETIMAAMLFVLFKRGRWKHYVV